MQRDHVARARVLALGALIAVLGVRTAPAAQLTVTVQNSQPQGGFGISPVWLGVHDGTYRTFTPGETVSPGLQTLAELGSPAGLAAAFAGHGSQAVAGSAPMGPGGSATTLLDVADPTTERYLSFAAMVVPSNDFFFGNSDPLGYRLFDASGHFTGPLTIKIYGTDVWDAGSEVNNINFGAAFIVGDDATDHVAENGVITSVFGGGTDFSSYLNSIDGKATPYGYDISHLISPGDLIATITINAVPEPASLGMLAAGFAAVGFAAVRRARRG
ncbi:Spondin_N [Aquisphaera giovannonii]|uniref:Spondin_N n=1 Tax=Aquisphaera giovannonii TaxID=406548 RepID=A0A5B9W407_9BACT|nr:spondin domain-containing protein [Aquisphaera giovannonii]QEH35343.1 Spondin_N [Aquisphaera giovannonii]